MLIIMTFVCGAVQKWKEHQMAKSDITVNISVSIADNTLYRCCSLLSMWLDDNPDKTLEVVEWHNTDKITRYLEVRER